jgi:hypothetical protein
MLKKVDDGCAGAQLQAIVVLHPNITFQMIAIKWRKVARFKQYQSTASQKSTTFIAVL